MKLKFQTQKQDDFSATLNKRVQRILNIPDFVAGCRQRLWVKLVLYALVFAGSYISLLYVQHESYLLFLVNFMLIGFSGILLAFNAAHDAVHGTFAANKKINRTIFSLCFNLQGVNAMLWRKRHIASHHVFPNVDGCDADIDDNPFIRLSPNQPLRPHHAWQHVYATGLYFLYTLQWVFVKDFFYLRKKELANLKGLKYSAGEVCSVIFWKCIYLCYIIIVPVVVGYSALWVLSAFVFMHAFISLFFVWTLIISHLCEETSFPKADEHGLLPYNFQQHQLEVSLDYHPDSIVANWIFGGFNAHTAHHLFHKLPHTVYPFISKTIRTTAAEYNYPYHSLPMHKAIISHYRHLKTMGRDC